MTKEDIVNRVWENLDLSKKESGEVVEQLLSCFKDVPSEGEKLKIGGFGVFEVRERKSRMGRNPKTGEEVPINPRRVLVFRPSQSMKAKVNGEAEG